MGNRTAKFISALFASALAGAPLSAVSQTTQSAAPPAQAAATPQNIAPAAQNTASAGDCLASPKGAAPHGERWYYRVERGTKRQCWYTRAAGPKPSQTAATETAAPQAAPAQAADAPSPQQPAPRTKSAVANATAPAAAPSRAVQNAHAEFTSPFPPVQAAPAPDATGAIAGQTAPAATPQAQDPASDTNAQSSASSAWPDVNDAASSQAQQAAPTANTRPAAKGSASSAPTTLTAADADKPTGSLQMLFLVIGGALALAGVLASVVYRFAGARGRKHKQVVADGPRRVNWDNREQSHAPTDEWEPEPAEPPTPWPWRNPPATAGFSPRAEHPRPVDFGFAMPQSNKPGVIELTDAHDLVKMQPDEAPHDEAPHDLGAGPDAEQADIIHMARDSETHEAEAETDHADKGADKIDIDAITLILERLAEEGPRLAETSSEAGFADFSQILPIRSGARA
jgi:hypothetical protein